MIYYEFLHGLFASVGKPVHSFVNPFKILKQSAIHKKTTILPFITIEINFANNIIKFLYNKNSREFSTNLSFLDEFSLDTLNLIFDNKKEKTYRVNKNMFRKIIMFLQKAAKLAEHDYYSNANYTASILNNLFLKSKLIYNENELLEALYIAKTIFLVQHQFFSSSGLEQTVPAKLSDINFISFLKAELENNNSSVFSNEDIQFANLLNLAGRIGYDWIRLIYELQIQYQHAENDIQRKLIGGSFVVLENVMNYLLEIRDEFAKNNIQLNWAVFNKQLSTIIHNYLHVLLNNSSNNSDIKSISKRIAEDYSVEYDFSEDLIHAFANILTKQTDFKYRITAHIVATTIWFFYFEFLPLFVVLQAILLITIIKYVIDTALGTTGGKVFNQLLNKYGPKFGFVYFTADTTLYIYLQIVIRPFLQFITLASIPILIGIIGSAAYYYLKKLAEHKETDKVLTDSQAYDLGKTLGKQLLFKNTIDT